MYALLVQYLRPLMRRGSDDGHRALRFTHAGRALLFGLAQNLSRKVSRSPLCTHPTGAGGLKDVTFLGYQVSPQGITQGIILAAQTRARHIAKARQLYQRCKRQKALAARLFADGNTIARNAPVWLQQRAYINITPQMNNPSYVMGRLRAYESRFFGWANRGLEHEKLGKSARA